MSDNGEDRISQLPDSIACLILSRLPIKYAVQTSVLSKDWKHKWTSIYNIQIVDIETNCWLWDSNDIYIALVAILDKILNSTQDSRITSFSLTCYRSSASLYDLRACITDVLTRDVQNLEIKTPYCKAGTFCHDDLHNWRSLKKLKLSLDCTLVVSILKTCSPNLEILCLGRRVKLLNNNEILSNHTGELLLSFPVLKELELICCQWHGATSIVINAPILTRFAVEGSRWNLKNDCLINIDGPKLENFESFGGLVENVVFNNSPSITYATITNSGIGDISGFQARGILESLTSLVHLKLSNKIIEALTEVNTDSPLPCFTQLKQLAISADRTDKALVKLLLVTPSVEEIILDVWDDRGNVKYIELSSLPSSIASRLKVVTLDRFEGTKRQVRFARDVLKFVEDLEKLVIVLCD